QTDLLEFVWIDCAVGVLVIERLNERGFASSGDAGGEDDNSFAVVFPGGELLIVQFVDLVAERQQCLGDVVGTGDEFGLECFELRRGLGSQAAGFVWVEPFTHWGKTAAGRSAARAICLKASSSMRPRVSAYLTSSQVPRFQASDDIG